MTRCSVLVGLALACVLLSPCLALADSAGKLYEKGTALLSQGEFDGAYEAFRQAAKADPENQEYRQQTALVRQVIKVRKRLGEEKDAQKWGKMANALRTFYHDNQVYGEALKIDREAHDRMGTGESAANLAETQLLAGKNAEAVELVSGLSPEIAIPRALAYLGIALARQGEIDRAKEIAGTLKIPVKAAAGLLFDCACLHALVGDKSGAAKLLTRCFEQTPPSRLDGAKLYAKQCEDLSSMVAGLEFAEALKTQSKVKESKCSGGTSCGKCPSKSSCSTDKKTSSSTKGKK